MWSIDKMHQAIYMTNNNKQTAQCVQNINIHRQVYNEPNDINILDKLVDQRYTEYNDYMCFCSGDKNGR